MQESWRCIMTLMFYSIVGAGNIRSKNVFCNLFEVEKNNICFVSPILQELPPPQAVHCKLTLLSLSDHHR